MRIKKVAETQTFGELFEQFLYFKKQENLSPKTIRTYENHFHCICNHLPATEKLNKSVVEEFYIKISQCNISQSSKNSYLRTFKVFLKWLGEDLPLPKIKTVRTYKETYTDEELRRLIKEPNKSCSYCEYRNWVIILLLIDTGMRAGSLRNIKPQDINYDNNTVVLKHVKTGIVQVLPFSSATGRALKKLGMYHTEYVFSSVYGEQLSENALILAIKDYCNKREVSSHSIHKFRHTFSKKFLLDCNGNAFTLQKMLGHSTLTMTQNYCNIYNEELIKDYRSPLETLRHKKIFKI